MSQKTSFVLSFLLAAALIVLSAATSVRAEYFDIASFHSDIVINENSTIEVTETIAVNFRTSRHGIYREIPFRYVTELGNKLEMPVTVKSVTHENGTLWMYDVSRDGNVISIRIGDPDLYVGDRQVYVIKYQAENALLFFEEHDELYWNVTGNNWQTGIKYASAIVRLNTDKTSSKIKCACYTGRYGSNDSDCEYEILENGARFVTNREFGSWQGFTVVMGWNKGIVTPPSEWQKFLWTANLKENWVFTIPIAVFLFMFFHWLRKGRDPKVQESLVVIYEPPKLDNQTITPAQLGTLVDERLDEGDLTASIVDLAVRGYLEMRELNPGQIELDSAETDYKLVKLKEPDDKLNQFDQTLLAKIFSGVPDSRDVSDLKNDFYKIVPRLRDIVFDDLMRLGCYSVKPEKVKRRYALIGALVAIVGMFAMFHLAPYYPAKGIVAAILSGFSIMAFAGIMPARTRIGSLVKKQIRGFQEFMNRADRDRVERLGQKVYYEYLSYAIALGVVDNWTKAFSGLLTEPPRWYVMSGPLQPFSAQTFSRSLSSATSQLGTAMFMAPRGSGLSRGGGGGFSGGGGGGFSGGGGGGGGGRSW